MTDIDDLVALQRALPRTWRKVWNRPMPSEAPMTPDELNRTIAYHDSVCSPGCGDSITTYPTPPEDCPLELQLVQTLVTLAVVHAVAAVVLFVSAVSTLVRRPEAPDPVVRVALGTALSWTAGVYAVVAAAV